MEITHLVKRDYTKESFQLYKITQAVFKAMRAAEHGDIDDAEKITESVYQSLLERKAKHQAYH